MMIVPLNKPLGMGASMGSFFDKKTPTDQSQLKSTPIYRSNKMGKMCRNCSKPLEKSSAVKIKPTVKNSMANGMPMIKMNNCQCFNCKKNFMYF